MTDTYPGVLERLLKQRVRAGGLEVINAGFPSYATVHAARYLRKFGAAFDPDLVVLGITPNDLVENNESNEPLRVIARDGAMVTAGARERDFDRWRDAKRWYSVYGYVNRSRLKRIVDRALVGLSAESEYGHRRAFQIDPDQEALRQYKLAEAYPLEAKAEADKMGAAFVVLAIPFREQFKPMPAGLDPARFGEHWADITESLGVPFVDLYPAFAAHPDPASLYWIEDGHCTTPGYRLIGETLAETIWRQRTSLGLGAD